MNPVSESRFLPSFFAVAASLVISPKTVGRHVENLYRKIGVRSRAAAALFAMDQDLLG